jgi:CubicO group peptidase (beta-lactamase class C family)
MSHPALEIQGTCDPRFEAVQTAFQANFDQRDEIGAAVAVTLEGQSVVDLWAGHSDPDRSRPWQRDTLVHVYSTTKGMTALCAHRLADRGHLDLDAPVSRYWPEFAEAGKEAIPVGWLLSHRSGLVALRKPQPPESLYDWDAMCTTLAVELPWFPPGEHLGYQAVTFGWLVGEVVRRVSGQSLGRYFRDEIARPLGADFHIGLGDDEIARCADITMIQPPAELVSNGNEDPFSTLPLIAFANPTGTGDHNCEAHRRAEIPAINGHGSARSLARIYGALAVGGTVDGVRLLSPGAVDALSNEHVSGIDEVQGIALRFGPGFMLNVPGADLFTPSPRSFGHLGAGGSAAFADPDKQLGFAYTCNRLGPHLDVDPRARTLIEACSEALG